jgi:hypothetical protein
MLRKEELLNVKLDLSWSLGPMLKNLYMTGSCFSLAGLSSLVLMFPGNAGAYTSEATHTLRCGLTHKHKLRAQKVLKHKVLGVNNQS